jgi:hypothetical protein
MLTGYFDLSLDFFRSRPARRRMSFLLNCSLSDATEAEEDDEELLLDREGVVEAGRDEEGSGAATARPLD